MENCSIIYDLIEAGYEAWWVPAFGFVGIFFTESIYRLLMRPLPNSLHSKRAMRGATIFFIIWSPVTFVWTYSDYYALRNAYLNGEYKQISGNIEHLADSESGVQPGMVRFSVNHVVFSYSRYSAAPGYRKTRDSGNPLHDGIPVRIRWIGSSIVRLEVCG
jgi:hypothetical protein